MKALKTGDRHTFTLQVHTEGEGAILAPSGLLFLRPRLMGCKCNKNNEIARIEKTAGCLSDGPLLEMPRARRLNG